MPASGTVAPSSDASAMTPQEGTMLGRMEGSTEKRRSNSASHVPRSRSTSIVRDAFVRSMTCAAPPVRFQAIQLSTVPNASSACERSTRSRIHSSLLAEKYGSHTRPVRSRTSSAGSAAHRAAVRRSCQTIAGYTGRPVARSHTIVVSRWFVRPIADSSSARIPASASAVAAVSSTLSQSSSGSCSTHPGRGYCCEISR